MCERRASIQGRPASGLPRVASPNHAALAALDNRERKSFFVEALA
jgi:hypothetical protein